MSKENVKKLALDERLVQDAKDGLLKFGRVSVSYLMYKLKCSEDMAKSLIIELERRSRAS